MRPYGWALRNLRKATTFRRRRGAGSEPRLGQDPPHTHVVRTGLRPKRKERGALRRFHRLAWPAWFTLGMGLLVHGLGPARGLSGQITFEFFPPLAIAVCVVFAARALFEDDHLAVRLPAIVANLLYPAYLLFLTVS